ncbi:hypothetical protein RND71_027647 [Anisodus tanguticus]|uniref:Endonuclease/exonuclease/phosphatase domain-containing protein n=1 Tax=Anisodus tanguticus TaxID=243964 RepID=A0AAE1RJ67_9SOLA|nr:hypothetical protein RND71_027647 [Anisodus tanguticus]
MGDFNTIMSNDERCNMAPITNYDTKDLVNCCHELGLADMNSTGCSFTFSRAGKFSKLDRALISGPWLQAGWYSHAIFRPSGTFSDHSPCLISIFDHTVRSNRPFKFFNMWSQHPIFDQTSMLSKQRRHNFFVAGVTDVTRSKLFDAFSAINAKRPRAVNPEMMVPVRGIKKDLTLGCFCRSSQPRGLDTLCSNKCQ